MFGQKDNDKKIESKQDKKTPMENIVIHTMKKDLANPDGPGFDQPEESAAATGLNIPKPADKKNITPTPGRTDITPPESSFSPAQKDQNLSVGPFASSAPTAPSLGKIIASPPESTPVSRPPITSPSPKDTFAVPTPPASPISSQPKVSLPADITLQNSFPWGKLLMIILVILIVLVAAGGTYYYWLTNPTNFQTLFRNILQKQSAPATTSNTPADNNLPAATQPAQPVQTFSLDKPNYLSIDTAAAPDGIKSEINDYVQKVIAQNPSTPVEFLVTDSQNNPVGFDKFAALAGINLPSSVMTNLSTDFSLFIYVDGGKARLGLEIGSKDLISTNLKNSLANEESNLPKDLESIFLVSGYTISNAAFNTSYYSGAEIRYFNIISPEELSVDYTIFRNKLLIGTTKMTLRSIIDYVSNSPGSLQPASSVPQATGSSQ